MKNNILFIVEGPKEEVQFLTHMLRNCRRDIEYEFFSYETNVHTLAKELAEHYPEFEEAEVDIKLVLKSIAPRGKDTSVLDRKYTDIFLVFDMEPQQDHPSFPLVRRMIRFFDDSTDHGKLFINYPMLQSFKHFSMLPDPSFQSRVVSMEEIRNYKELVGEVTGFPDVTKYSYETFYSISVHQVMKANYVLNGWFLLPEVEEYLKFDAVRIWDLEYEKMEQENVVDVLNTSMFVLCDFAPTKYFQLVKQHENKFLLP